ncbi:hypothetical protein SNE40_003955 [Patella caerulea]|uniref:Fe2OG dioxygenase domain-containing protein n=1 Tax=Patella caerulea TaxID=87958 RepID=A0AAN8K925_PATCE
MASIIKEAIELPWEPEGCLAFGLYNVFTPQECKELIEKTEAMGYTPALINNGYGQVLETDVRNNTRCIWDSKEQAQRIWNRVKDHVCKEFHGYTALGLNERLRFLRYDPGEYFKPHHDGCYQRDNGEASLITLQLYLNEGFKGGSTTFLSATTGDRVEFVPKTGAILIFQHDILHEGSLLEEGRKYSCRTDIMFGKDKILA